MEDSNETQAATDTAQGKRLPRLTIVIIIVTGIAVWLVPEQESPTPETPPKTTLALPAPKVIPKPQAEAPIGSKTEVPPKVETEAPPGIDTAAPPPIVTETRPGEHARTLIARLRNGNGNGNVGSEAFAEAERERKAGRAEDAYLLYFFAAKQGHGEAALILGTQSDPAYFSPASGMFEEADLAQTYKWYRMAADNGNSEATRRLASLFERVEKQAEGGDENARRLMLQWR